MAGDTSEMVDPVPQAAVEAKTSLPADDRLAAKLRGFGPLGIIAILAIIFSGNLFLGRMFALPIGAILMLIWVRLSRTPWRDIGYVRPKSWIATAAISVAAGIT